MRGFGTRLPAPRAPAIADAPVQAGNLVPARATTSLHKFDVPIRHY
jgi:hypothetical protein